MKYRAGHGEERMTPLSVEYCRRVRAHLAAIGSPIVAGGDGLGVSASIPSHAPKAAPSATAVATAKLSRPNAIHRVNSVAARGTKVLPPQRPAEGSRVTAAGGLTVPSAKTRSLVLAQEKEKARRAKIRQMWAAHDARMQSISAKLRPESLRIATGI
jgi:hypothetical protein